MRFAPAPALLPTAPNVHRVAMMSEADAKLDTCHHPPVCIAA